MTDRTIHPIESCREGQQKYLDDAPNEEIREMLAFSFRTGNVTIHYYSTCEAEPNEDDYAEWLEGLHEPMASFHASQGFEKTKGVLGLRRHAAERRDLGLDAYMKESISPEDYAKWRKLAADSNTGQ